MLQATINPRSITPHPSNPRRDVGDVTDLAASIAAVGLLEPLVVAPWPADLGPTPDPTCPTCGATGKCRTPPEPEPDGDLEGDDLQDDEDFAYDDDEDFADDEEEDA